MGILWEREAKDINIYNYADCLWRDIVSYKYVLYNKYQRGYVFVHNKKDNLKYLDDEIIPKHFVGVYNKDDNLHINPKRISSYDVQKFEDNLRIYVRYVDDVLCDYYISTYCLCRLEKMIYDDIFKLLSSVMKFDGDNSIQQHVRSFLQN